MNTHKKLALGTVQFGMSYGISNQSGKTPEEEVSRILNYAFKTGIKTLDTAFGYGDSESVLGKLNHNRFDIVTKFLPETHEGKIKFQFETSLNRLKVSNIYGYMAHRPLDILDNEHIWEYLIELKKINRVKKIGFSFNSPDEYVALKSKGFIPDLVQLPFNYFDHRFIEIMEDLKKTGCEIHSRSPFLQGLFFMNPNNLPDHFKDVVGHIKELQDKLKTNLAGSLLNYVLSCTLIDKVVLGVQNLQQLKWNLESLEKTSIPETFSEKLSDSILQPSKWVV